MEEILDVLDQTQDITNPQICDEKNRTSREEEKLALLQLEQQYDKNMRTGGERK